GAPELAQPDAVYPAGVAPGGVRRGVRRRLPLPARGRGDARQAGAEVARTETRPYAFRPTPLRHQSGQGQGGTAGSFYPPARREEGQRCPPSAPQPPAEVGSTHRPSAGGRGEGGR